MSVKGAKDNSLLVRPSCLKKHLKEMMAHHLHSIRQLNHILKRRDSVMAPRFIRPDPCTCKKIGYILHEIGGKWKKEGGLAFSRSGFFVPSHLELGSASHEIGDIDPERVTERGKSES